ncbi:MAG TPA: AMP-binding protein [Friedmanniella sp.]
MTSGSTATLLRPVGPAELPAALAAALDGGAPVAPLPDEAVERALALRALRLDEPADAGAAVVVLSSGSTAEPKAVVLSAAAIRAGAGATHDRLGGPGHWLLPLPSHHVAGLMVLARAHLAGTAVVPLTRDLADLVGLALPSGRCYLSVVPTQLVRALEHPALVAALAGLDAVLVGGGAVDPTVLARARAAGIACVTTYGMSETCGGCVYDGVPLAGVDVQAGPGDGRVSIAGAVLFSGYRGRPDLTAEALVAGRFRTADRARWSTGPDGTARLEVLGRTDDVVVSGGLNVDLAAVEARAQAWPARGAAELAVVGVPHPQWGVEVVAVTDAPPGEGLTLAPLQAWVRAELPAYAAPRRLVVLERLPHTPSGKVDRRRLQTELTEPESTR